MATCGFNYDLHKVLFDYEKGTDMFANFYINMYNTFEFLCKSRYGDQEYCSFFGDQHNTDYENLERVINQYEEMINLKKRETMTKFVKNTLVLVDTNLNILTTGVLDEPLICRLKSKKPETIRDRPLVKSQESKITIEISSKRKMMEEIKEHALNYLLYVGKNDQSDEKQERPVQQLMRQTDRRHLEQKSDQKLKEKYEKQLRDDFDDQLKQLHDGLDEHLLKEQYDMNLKNLYDKLDKQSHDRRIKQSFDQRKNMMGQIEKRYDTVKKKVSQFSDCLDSKYKDDLIKSDFHQEVNKTTELSKYSVTCMMAIQNKMRYEALKICKAVNPTDLPNCPDNHPHLQPLFDLIKSLFTYERDQDMRLTVYHRNPCHVDNSHLKFFYNFIQTHRLDIIFNSIRHVCASPQINVDDYVDMIDMDTNHKKAFVIFLNNVINCDNALKCHTYDSGNDNLTMFIIFDYLLRYIPFSDQLTANSTCSPIESKEAKETIFDKLKIDKYDESPNINDMIQSYIYRTILLYSEVNFNDTKYVTCVETTILNILIKLFHNPVTDKIDLITQFDDVNKFFETDLATIKYDYRSKYNMIWANLLSNRRGIEYRKTNREVTGNSIGDMLLLLKPISDQDTRLETKTGTIDDVVNTVRDFLNKYRNTRLSVKKLSNNKIMIEGKYMISISSRHCDIKVINNDPVDIPDINNIFLKLMSLCPSDNVKKELLLNNIVIIQNITDQKNLDLKIRLMTENQYAILQKCSNYNGRLILPDKVIGIDDNAFSVCKSITSLIFGSGTNLTYIGYSAFAVCTNLSGNLIIPDTVTHIGRLAFYGCAGISGLSIGRNVVHIGGSAFGNSGISGKLIIPDKVKYIGPSSFARCPDISDLVIGLNVIIIDNYAFTECTGIQCNLIIPESVTHIGQGVFKNCHKIFGLLIGSNIITIENFAFSGCEEIKGELKIPNKVIEIGDEAFSGCHKISGLVIGLNVRSIGNKTFYDCIGISSELKIPANVTHIGDEAFANCKNVSNVSNFAIGSHVFMGNNVFNNMGINNATNSPPLTS